MIELLARLIARIKLDPDQTFYVLIPLGFCMIALAWRSVELAKVYFGLDSFKKARGSILSFEVKKDISGVRHLASIKYKYVVDKKEYTSNKISPYVLSKSTVEKDPIDDKFNFGVGSEIEVWFKDGDPKNGYLEIKSSAFEFCLSVASMILMLFLGGLIIFS